MAITQDTLKKLKIGTIIAVVVYVIVLIAVKRNNPSFDIFKIVLYTLVFGAALAAIGFGVRWFSKKTGLATPTDNKLPAPITFPQVRELAKQALRDPHYADEFDMSRCEVERVLEVGKANSNVYLIVAYGKHSKADRYAIGINMHYPELKRGFLVNPKTNYEILKMANDLGVDHKDELPIRRVTSLNPLTGTPTTLEEPVISKEDDKIKKEDPLAK